MASNIATGLSLALGVLYVSAQSRQQHSELEIAETIYNSKQLPDEQLSTEEIRRVQRAQCNTAGVVHAGVYTEDLSAADKARLKSQYDQYVASCTAAEIQLGGGLVDIEPELVEQTHA